MSIEVLASKLQFTPLYASFVILVKKLQYALRTRRAMANQLQKANHGHIQLRVAIEKRLETIYQLPVVVYEQKY